MGSSSSAPNPVGDELPEDQLVAAMLRSAATLSIVAFFVLAFIVYRHRLLRTALMKQVLCLCMCDCLTCLWEMLSCPSMVHWPDYCISTPCPLFMPMLRTFQMSSVILSAQIAVSVAFVVHGRRVPLAGGVSWVLPAALVLCLPSWLVTIFDKWQPAYDTSTTYCGSDPDFSISPDKIWAVEITVLLAFVLFLYASTMWRIWRLASPPIVARKLQRVLSYLVVFLFCYAPYVLWQGLGDTTKLYDAMANSTFYQACYLLYLLTGLCNVASYGVHNWDDSCWSRGATSTRLVAGREIRVVMFANRSEEIARSIQASLSGSQGSHVSAQLSMQESQTMGESQAMGEASQESDVERQESADRLAAELNGCPAVAEAVAAAVEYGVV